MFLSGKCEEGRTGSAPGFANDFDLKKHDFFQNHPNTF